MKHLLTLWIVLPVFGMISQCGKPHHDRSQTPSKGQVRSNNTNAEQQEQQDQKDHPQNDPTDETGTDKPPQSPEPVEEVKDPPVTYATLKEKVIAPLCGYCHYTCGSNDVPCRAETDYVDFEKFIQNLVIIEKLVFNNDDIDPAYRMPPRGTTQLTQDQKNLYYRWLQDGKLP